MEMKGGRRGEALQDSKSVSHAWSRAVHLEEALVAGAEQPPGHSDSTYPAGPQDGIDNSNGSRNASGLHLLSPRQLSTPSPAGAPGQPPASRLRGLSFRTPSPTQHHPQLNSPRVLDAAPWKRPSGASGAQPVLTSASAPDAEVAGINLYQHPAARQARSQSVLPGQKPSSQSRLRASSVSGILPDRSLPSLASHDLPPHDRLPAIQSLPDLPAPLSHTTARLPPLDRHPAPALPLDPTRHATQRLTFALEPEALPHKAHPAWQGHLQTSDLEGGWLRALLVRQRDMVEFAQEAKGGGQAAGGQRRILILRLPSGAAPFQGGLPVAVSDKQGGQCLLVLPSEKPSSRREAIGIELLLMDLVVRPPDAADRAAQWRLQMLQECCPAALANLSGSQAASATKAWFLSDVHSPGISPEASYASTTLRGGVNSPSPELIQAVSNAAASMNLAQTAKMPVGMLGQTAARSASVAFGATTTFRANLTSAHPTLPGSSPADNPVLHMTQRATPTTGKRASFAVEAHTTLDVSNPSASPAAGSKQASPTPMPADAHAADPSDAAEAIFAHADAMEEDGSPAELAGSGDLAWDLFCTSSMAVAMTIAMADLVRQVEVQCAERGRSLALVWNLYTAALDATVGRLQSEVRQMTEAHMTQAAESMRLQQDTAKLAQLQDEVVQLKAAAETARLDVRRAELEAEDVRSEANGMQSEMGGIGAQIDQRLAHLRWKYVFATVGMQVVPGRLPSAASSGPNATFEKIEALERTAAEVAYANKRKDAYRRSFKAGKRGGNEAGATFANLIHGTMAGPADDIMAAMADPSKAALLMAVLTPEARAMVLAGMTSFDRGRLLAAMAEDDVASTLVVMSEAARTQAMADLTEVDVALTNIALEHIRDKPNLACKWLAGMSSAAAAAEYLLYEPGQQYQALLYMRPGNAASLLEELPVEVRTDALRLQPHGTSAKILRAMPRQLAVDSLLATGNPAAYKVLTVMAAEDATAMLRSVTNLEGAMLLQGLADAEQQQVLALMPRSKWNSIKAELLRLTSAMWADAEADELEGFAVLENLMMMSEEQGRATGSMHTLPFEDKVALLSTLDPAAAAAIIGVLSGTEAAAVMALMPQGSLASVAAALDDAVQDDINKSVQAAKKRRKGSKVAPGKGGHRRSQSSLASSHGSKDMAATLRGLRQLSATFNEQASPEAEDEEPEEADDDDEKEEEAAEAEEAEEGEEEEDDDTQASYGPGDEPQRGRARAGSIGGKAGKQLQGKASRRSRGPSIMFAGDTHGGDAAVGGDFYVPKPGEAGGIGWGKTTGRKSLFGADGGPPGGPAPGASAARGAEERLGKFRRAMSLMPNDPKLKQAQLKQQGGLVRTRSESASRASANWGKAGLVGKITLKRSSVAVEEAKGYDDEQEDEELRKFEASLQAKEAQAGSAGALGHRPKDQRLLEAIAKNRNAKCRTPLWLLGVIDDLYAEIEARTKKQADDIKLRITMPEVTFAFFHQKYGRKALVDEYVGSLVNTLEKYKEGDMRLAVYANFLTEEWEMYVVLLFIQANAMLSQTAPVSCLEYPKEPAKGEQYPWVCLNKAAFISDAMLGSRSAQTRDRFLELLKLRSIPAVEADMQYLVVPAERRDNSIAPGQARKSMALVSGAAPKVTDFWKLPRICFLQLLCEEVVRINSVRAEQLRRLYRGLHLNAAGDAPLAEVADLLHRTLMHSVEAGELAALEKQFKGKAALIQGGREDAELASMTVETFLAAAEDCQPLRDYIRLTLTEPAPLPGQDSDKERHAQYLAVVVTRHTKAMMEAWERQIMHSGPLQAKLLDEAARVRMEKVGDAKLKAYLAMLQMLGGALIQKALESILAIVITNQGLQAERQLCRVEDAVLVLHGVNYMLATDSNLSEARRKRMPGSLRAGELLQAGDAWRRHHADQQEAAAQIIQAAWRKHSRRRSAAGGLDV